MKNLAAFLAGCLFAAWLIVGKTIADPTFRAIAPADLPTSTVVWKLTVNSPEELVAIDQKGVVTIHGDVHSRAFWEKVANGFKEDCPPHIIPNNFIPNPLNDMIISPTPGNQVFR